MAETDLYHPDEADLSEISDVLKMAYHSVSYLIWKRTGQLPPPLDMEVPLAFDEDKVEPF